MRAALFATRARLGRRTAGAVALVVLLSLTCGACLASLAGARRTHTAIPRFLDWAHAPNAYVDDVEDHMADIERLPNVEASVRAVRTLYFVAKPDGTPDHRTSASVIAILGGSAAPASTRYRVLEGRAPRPDDPTEVVVSRPTARHLGLDVGSELTFGSYTPAEAEALFAGEDVAPTGPAAEVHVVGIARHPTDLSTSEDTPNVIYRGNDSIVITPALLERNRGKVADFSAGLSVRLRNPDVDLPAFAAAAHRIVGPDHMVAKGSDELIVASQAQRAARLESLALWIFGFLLGAGILLIGGQALARQVELEAEDANALRAVGMTRRAITVTVMARPALIIAAAGVGSVATAIGLSVFTPIGIARLAEPAPGVSVDGLVLLGGAAALCLLLAARAAFSAWRLARPARAVTAPPHLGGTVADRLVAGGLPVVPVTGVRFALDPIPGRRRPAAWSAMVGCTIGVLAVTGTLVFGASLTHFVRDPHAQGWTWDAAVGNPHGDDLTAVGTQALQHDRDVAAYAGIGAADARLEGRDVSLLAFQPRRGTLEFPVLDGRLPGGPGEVALGGREMRRLDTHVGGVVTAATEHGTTRLRVVGEVLVSPLVLNDSIELGDGGLVRAEAARRIAPELVMSQFVVDFRAGADDRAVLARLQRGFPNAVLTGVRAGDVQNLQRIRALPFILAALLAAVAVGTVAHSLITSTSGRRRDIAVLRSLGFVSPQVLRTVWWQSAVIVGFAIVIGMPLGLALGRIGWSLLEGQMAILSAASTPVGALAALVAATLVVALLVASGPAVQAASTTTSAALRTE